MNEKQRLIKNTGLIAIGSLSTKVVSFFLLPLYTALLSTEEFGTVDYIVSISTFCVPFISLLMDEAIFRYLIDCKTDDERRKAISSSICLVLIGITLFLLIATPILLLIKYKYTLYLILYVLSAVLTQMTCALIRGTGNTKKYVLISFCVSSLTIVLNVLLIAVIKFGLRGMLISSIVAHTVVPLGFILAMRLWRLFSFRWIDGKLMKSMIRYSLPLIPNKISWSIINLSDRILIMNLINSSASGLYAAAHKFPNLVDTVYGFFYQSWKESSARALHDEGADKFYNYVYKYLKNFMFAFVLCATAFMPIIFRILINESYNEAILYVPILVLATYFSNMSGFFGGIFTAYKDTKIMGTTTVIAAVINLAVHLALIYFVGLYAAAISSLAANLIVYIYRKIKVKKHITLDKDILNSVLACVAMAVIWVLFYSDITALHIVGYIIAPAYSVFINRELIGIILSKVGRKVKK